MPVFSHDDGKIRFKRKHPEEVYSTTEKQDSYTTTDNSDLSELFFEVINVMDQYGRKDDFISMLHAIKDGYLLQNIAFHLLLDVGLFYGLSSISNMRYDKQSLAFWITVHKLFKGRGINFFRGYKAEGITRVERITPSDCKINFIVPSDKVLQRESAVYKMDSSHPGLLKISLDAFSNENAGQDVKLSMDGKKLSIGFGELGEEDLGGLEEPPTLKDRKERIANEIETLGEIKVTLEMHNVQSLINLDPDVKSSLRKLLIVSISNMSHRIKEIRELSVRKKTQLENLKQKVDGKWIDCKFAPTISFLHTKLTECKTCTEDLLDSIDKLGYMCACLNGTGKAYVQGSQVTVDLNTQTNFMCLREVNGDEDCQQAHFTKQRTHRWFKLRRAAWLTGSTMFQALGLDTLKSQQQHFDQVKSGVDKPVSDTVQKYMDHGARNEINALATVLGKVLPVFHPEYVFREDGCEVVEMENGFMVISGDGTAVNKQMESVVAFEMKCPMEGKIRTTDVHYAIPKYYTTQLLCEMASKTCNEYAYICYTSESTTYIKGEMNMALWTKLLNLANTLYADKSSPRPTRKHESIGELLEELKSFASEATFVAEFPSLCRLPCKCDSVTAINDAFHMHENPTDSPEYSTGDWGTDNLCIESAIAAMQAGYNVLRRPAKEILVTVVSDLHRTLHSSSHTHAVPIQYALSGFSLKMDTARKYIEQAVKACQDRHLMVKAIAFDGQFSEIAVNDPEKQPLTILQLMKRFWQKVQKLGKEEKLKALLEGSVACPSPENISKASASKQSLAQDVGDCEMGDIDDTGTANLCTEDSNNDSPIDNAIPDDNMGPRCTTSSAIDTALKDDSDLEADDHDARSEAIARIEEVLIGLISMNPTNDSKWSTCTLEDFKKCVATGKNIKKSFTVKELQLIIDIIGATPDRSKMLKADYVNIVSRYLGDSSQVERNALAKSPRSLKQIVTKHIKSWKTAAINVAYAQIHFKHEYEEWNMKNTFSGPWNICTDGGTSVTLHQWYAQPSHVNDHTVQMVIDPHHLFVNNRCKCCSSGMPAMGVHPSAWWKVASDKNDTGISLEIAKELRDRQSNSFAQRTFSAEVEKEMRNNGDITSTNWCRLIRNWYSAVDTAGISIEKRLEWMMDMRNNLLKYLKVGEFPPPTQYIGDMPIVQYEGFLCNIDRRLQLYLMVQGSTYNQRAISSLDSGNFFAAFQVGDT